MNMTHPAILKAMATGYGTRRPPEEWTGRVVLAVTLGVDIGLEHVARDAAEAGREGERIVQRALRGKPGVAVDGVEVTASELDAGVDPKLANMMSSSGVPRLWTGRVTLAGSVTVDVGTVEEVNDATQAEDEAMTILRRALTGVSGVETDDVVVESTEADAGCED